MKSATPSSKIGDSTPGDRGAFGNRPSEARPLTLDDLLLTESPRSPIPEPGGDGGTTGSLPLPDPMEGRDPESFRFRLASTGGKSLPDDVFGLMDRMDNPASLAEAEAILERLSVRSGRDAFKDYGEVKQGQFTPAVRFSCGGDSPAQIRIFALTVLPLRQRLSEQFPVPGPEVEMLLDLLALAYWRAVQADRGAEKYMEAAMVNERFAKTVLQFEQIKAIATKQIQRLLEALRLVTGVSTRVDPPGDVASLIPFPRPGAPATARRRAV